MKKISQYFLFLMKIKIKINLFSPLRVTVPNAFLTLVSKILDNFAQNGIVVLNRLMKAVLKSYANIICAKVLTIITNHRLDIMNITI